MKGMDLSALLKQAAIDAGLEILSGMKEQSKKKCKGKGKKKGGKKRTPRASVRKRKK